MNVVLLKTKSDEINITTQQNAIIKYARSHGFSLDSTEIEGSEPNDALEERKEFKGFLRSLNEGDNILIYDLWVYSKDMGELTTIIECLLKRDISTILCYPHAIIGPQTSPLELVTILAKFREKNIKTKKELTQGRPKGRMSKSKFDIHRTKIVELLEEGNSVSKIARILEVSRTSLKDYINSRGLKELVQAKKTLLKEPLKNVKIKSVIDDKECSFIKENKGK